MLSTGFVYLLISGLLQCLFVVDKCSVILFVLYIKFFIVYIAYQLIFYKEFLYMLYQTYFHVTLIVLLSESQHIKYIWVFEH